MRKAAFLFLISPFCHLLSLGQSISWQHVNGPPGGWVKAFAENQISEIFAGTEGGGIYKSTDSGDSWIHVTSLHQNLTVMALCVTPGGSIFAGTWGNGIMRSTDNGDTWEFLNSSLQVVTSLVCSQNGFVFAGSIYDGEDLLRSTDNGQTWTNIRPTTGAAVSALGIDHLGTLFASFSSDVWPGTRRTDRSTDNGETWLEPYYTAFGSFAVNDSNDVFATDGGQVYRSIDDGISWQVVWCCGPGLNGGSAINEAGHVFVGIYEDGVIRSTDNGLTWSFCNGPGLFSKEIWCLFASGSGALFAGTQYDGAFKTTNEGASWENIALNSSAAYSLETNTIGNLFVSNARSVFSSSDAGDTWLRSQLDSTHFHFFVGDLIALISDENNYVYAGLRHGYVGYTGVYRSSNGGLTWDSVGFGRNVYSFAVFSGVLFAGVRDEGIFCTTNHGDTWEQTGLTVGTVKSLLVGGDSTLFEGGDGVVKRSADFGDSWVPVLLGDVTFTSLLCLEDGSIFAGTSQIYGYGDTLGIFRSTDNGDSWSQVNTGLASLSVNALARNSSNHIFAGTNDGLFVSTNGGEMWIGYNENLPNTSIIGITVDSADFAYIGTRGGGVFRTTEPTTSVGHAVGSLPGMITLSQNYPNPFNPRTTFEFSIPRTLYANLSVYNLLGEKVTTVIDEQLSAGTHRVNWDATGQPSGVYFYRLRAGEFVETRKLILLR